MNKVFLVGRLTADPIFRITTNQIKQVRFTIAVKDDWNKNNTYFFPCVAWQKQAEYTQAYVTKGTMVGIDGRLIIRSYRDSQNTEVKITEIVVNNIHILHYPARRKTDDFASDIIQQDFADVAPEENLVSEPDSDFFATSSTNPAELKAQAYKQSEPKATHRSANPSVANSSQVFKAKEAAIPPIDLSEALESENPTAEDFEDQELDDYIDALDD